MAVLIVDGRKEIRELLEDMARAKGMSAESFPDWHRAIWALAGSEIAGAVKFNLVAVSRENASTSLPDIVEEARVIRPDMKFFVLTTSSLPEVISELVSFGRGVAGAFEPIDFLAFSAVVDGLEVPSASVLAAN